MKCFVTCSPEGGITPTILVEILAYLDQHNLFPRTDNLMPHLVTDGHDTRFHPTIVKYIFHPDHRWALSFGYPYGTHKWQFGDSEYGNGALKIQETIRKRAILEEREVLNLEPLTLQKTLTLQSPITLQPPLKLFNYDDDK